MALVASSGLAALATDQQKTYILIDGVKREMQSIPLVGYFARMEEPPEFSSITSANRIGFKSEWELRDDKLFLTRFEAAVNFKTAKIEDFIPDCILPHHANWFTGRLQIPIGNPTQAGRYRESEYKRIEDYRFKDGVVITHAVRSNDKIEYSKHLVGTVFDNPIGEGWSVTRITQLHGLWSAKDRDFSLEIAPLENNSVKLTFVENNSQPNKNRSAFVTQIGDGAFIWWEAKHTNPEMDGYAFAKLDLLGDGRFRLIAAEHLAFSDMLRDGLLDGHMDESQKSDSQWTQISTTTESFVRAIEMHGIRRCFHEKVATIYSKR